MNNPHDSMEDQFQQRDSVVEPRNGKGQAGNDGAVDTATYTVHKCGCPNPIGASYCRSCGKSLSYSLVLTDAGPSKLSVVKAIQTNCKIPLIAAKRAADNPPVRLFENLTGENAIMLRCIFKELDASVIIKDRSMCSERTIKSILKQLDNNPENTSQANVNDRQMVNEPSVSADLYRLFDELPSFSDAPVIWTMIIAAPIGTIIILISELFK